MKPVGSGHTRVLLYSKDSGLANRLRAFHAYRALASCMGARFQLCWDPTVACEAEFTDLFCASNIEMTDADGVAQARKDSLTLTFEDTSTFRAIWERNAARIGDWSRFCSEVEKSIGLLKACPEISSAVGRRAAKLSIESRIGLHIRHSDNLTEYRHWKKNSAVFRADYISTLQGFEAVVRRRSAERFFLATDNPAVEARFLRIPGVDLVSGGGGFAGGARLRAFLISRVRVAKCFYSLPGFHPRRRTSSVKTALIDLLTLARCSEVVGTYFSSYSKMSALMGSRIYSEIHGLECVSAPDM